MTIKRGVLEVLLPVAVMTLANATVTTLLRELTSLIRIIFNLGLPSVERPYCLERGEDSQRWLSDFQRVARYNKWGDSMVWPTSSSTSLAQRSAGSKTSRKY
ncbi:hypothetical protein LAZ67_1006011 [Cordylochernes scorpioides]|uniref:Secreted protein n=1 Tax=Cordylochernes scorpioides TaxID=51811 RepID=A0ABY6JZB1_9ARAC|nr:hypothetical protein LAZ67_1006011 [Cordylochernes scorpioides]